MQMINHPFNQNSLFKYVPFDINALYNILNNQVFYSHVSCYNDPAELLLDFQFTEYYNTYERHLNNEELSDFHDCIKIIMESKKRRNPALEKQRPSPVEPHVKKEIASIIQSKYRCLSLCRGDLSTLMFAHYADSFKGICLVYDGDLEYFKGIHKVKYTGYFQTKFIHFVDGVKTLKEAYTRKHREWRYENEFRILKEEREFVSPSLSNAGYLDPIPKEALKHIILGSRIRIQDRDILTLLKKYGAINAEIYTSDVKQNGVSVNRLI